MQALIFDLDDTLLDAQKRISPRTQRALLDCAAAGYRLVICTSRPIRAVRHFIDDALLAHFTTITLNGGIIFQGIDFEHPRILARLGARASNLLADIEACDPLAHITIELDGWHFASNRYDDPSALLAYQLARPEMALPIQKVSPDQASKIAVDGYDRKLNACLALATVYPDLYFVPALEGRFLSVVPAGINKASTLELLAGEGHFDLAASYAFGDDAPDIVMFSVVGHAVAMGNARPDVKKAAQIQIGDCNQEAIGLFLEELLGS